MLVYTICACMYNVCVHVCACMYNESSMWQVLCSVDVEAYDDGHFVHDGMALGEARHGSACACPTMTPKHARGLLGSPLACLGQHKPCPSSAAPSYYMHTNTTHTLPDLSPPHHHPQPPRTTTPTDTTTRRGVAHEQHYQCLAAAGAGG
jgi:hypothetical protein